MCYFFIAARRAQKMESENLASSQLIIEGQEKENERVSRELHDVVLPLVKDANVSELIRSICRKLMPLDFDRLSLSASIIEMCARFSADSNIEYLYSIEDSLDFAVLSSEKQLHLYRMIQESLNNVEKHSCAKKAIVTARKSDDAGILVCISDDGIGLSEKTQSNKSMGMTNMQQRAAIIGANLDFISESGHGLMVRIEIAD
jgi:two-component system NarL family sensor kinase